MNLEDEIRAALRRREPSPDFTARVLARVSAAPARPRRPWVRWVAAMAASVLLAAGAAEYRHYRGEQAKSQVMLAVKIAAAKLNKVHKKVQMLNAVHRSNS
jgi:hypothetical protein